MSHYSTPVAIVGGGPVGMLLALFLEKHGVESTIFNIEKTSRWHPKGSTHNSRTMEHYRWLGIADRIRGLGLPADYPRDIAYFTTLIEPELTRIKCLSEIQSSEKIMASDIGDQVPEPLLRSNQMFTERFLLEHIKGRKIKVKFGTEVTHISQSDRGVFLVAKNVDSEVTEYYSAEYAVGCDGANSFVRKWLGIKYEGEEILDEKFLSGRMISGYLKIPDLENLMAGKKAWMYNVISEHERFLLISLDGNGEYLLMAKGDSQTQLPNNEDVIKKVQRGIGRSLPIEVLRIAQWTSGLALVAEKFNRGRIYLAGDSCHLFSPTGGYGMNTGIDDARNLAWKLAAVIQGWAGRQLLQSYEQERKAIAYRNTKAAKFLTKRTSTLEMPKSIYEGKSGVEARDAVGKKLFDLLKPQFTSLGVELGARYESSIVFREDTELLRDNWESYIPSCLPGARLPHLWLDEPLEVTVERSGRVSIYDVLGSGFTLVYFGNNSGIQRLSCIAGQNNIPLKILRLNEKTARVVYSRRYMLVRPDHHICWSGNALPENLPELLSVCTGGKEIQTLAH